MNRPKIILNVAMSLDGKIALKGGRRIRISNEDDLRRVHNLRNSVDAILVGINTIIKDDPKLTVKEKFVDAPRNPIRIVLDSNLRIPENARILHQKGRTIIATTRRASGKLNGVEIIRCGEDIVDLNCLLKRLYQMGIRSILVEGGRKVLTSFLMSGLVDEFSIFIGPIMIGSEGIDLIDSISTPMKFEILNSQRMGDGILLKVGVLYDRDDPR